MLINKEDLEAINKLNHKECFEQGYIKARNDFIKQFEFEINNNVVSFETLKKIIQIKSENDITKK